MIYNVAIIGGASAGLTSAIYCARKKLNTILLTKNVGGQSLLTDRIENFPGFDIISGHELTEKIRGQVNKYGVRVEEGADVESLRKKDGNFIINLKNKNIIEAKSVIVATGKTPGRLNVPGEKEFENKGVSFCTTCDAPLFSRKKVAVVGGGNSGLNAALDLVQYADKVYLMGKGIKIIGDELLQERLKNSGKAEFITNALVKEILGKDFMEKIIYKDLISGKEKTLEIGGLFVNVGWTPATGFLKDFINLNEKGEIIIDPRTNETSVKGIFAAGDATDIKYKQCVIAAGEGAKAALSAYTYLTSRI
jgi:thioredoxin-disulfide reductase